MPNNDLLKRLSGTLRIQLTQPAESQPPLLNQAAPANAQIESVEFEAQYWDSANQSARPFTANELASIVIAQPRIRMSGEGAGVVEHVAPNGIEFSLQALIRAIEETERQTRQRTEWFGGIDVHHIFFEEIYLSDEGIWETMWGS